ncbi:Similar to HSD17B10: 3-hydroxyacyl-CoA dehydrogenase type-2 (Homo sapiens) [Cotesia congregata]|uniref:Similar to HSD17B10: 3-hydroxyacyl-CoA dehydrogenase type-2 (Homo sapiens) n=1 Tax=Cotesia congregata TaxID=51543 RepID=A0A8J2EIY9_COTCN|nr:Similar to HSD17B10: 3-hydroxyacyl-CoA dehydrogenase type-2 (Homo sapiens) [Cotesia congregata]
MEAKMKKVVAVVTGGSSGVGKSIVERIIRNEGRVIVIDIDEEKGQAVAKSLGSNVVFVKADVTSEKEVKEALAIAKNTFLKINVLINCAGIVKWGAPYDFERNAALSIESFQKVMDVNALGTFNVTRLVAGLMGENEPDENGERGVIINIGSVLAADGNVDFFAYSVSKATVVGMTIPLARAFADKAIRVQLNEAMLKLNLFPKRLGQPEEIAHLIQCVIENPFINAVNLTISGGFHQTN